MAYTITHTHVSAIADDGSDVGSNAWNANHTISGSVDLAADVSTTILPIANGGTGQASLASANIAVLTSGVLATSSGGTGQGSLASANIAVLNATNTFTAAQIVNGAITADALIIDHTNTDVKLSRPGAAGSLGLHHSTLTSAAAFQVYNTSDTLSGAPTNYERGVFDWTTVANALTIGTQAGGTGTGRDVHYQSGSNLHQFRNSGGVPTLQLSNIAITAYPSGTFGFSASTDASNGADNSLSRAANSVIAFGNGSANTLGWLQWAGQKRVTSDFGTATATLSTVTDLTVALQAGRTYSFDIWLQMTDAAAGGVKAAVSSDGTLTATAIQYTGYTIADNAIKALTNSTALGTAVGSTTTTITSGIVIVIKGTITVNVAGSMLVQIAQNTSNATATTVKRGSYMIIQDMP